MALSSADSEGRAYRNASPSLRFFLAGACAASALWFTALGYGAARLAPWFARPTAWRRLDAIVGVTMLVLAAMLTRPLLWP